MIAALPLLCIANISATAQPEPSLCSPGATPLFTCAIGAKIVSICNAGGKAAYYFGKPERVEMSSKALSVASQGFSGGGETQIYFKNGAYTYIVYDRTERTSFSAGGPNSPDSSSGLSVLKGDKTISDTACGSDATISADATRIIPEGPYVEHDVGKASSR